MRLNFLKDCHPKRFLKFSAVGVVNFLIDLSILNLLSFATGINRGIFAAFFSAVSFLIANLNSSFLIANLNSYFWNKKWTFKKDGGNSSYKPFLAISILGVAVNVFVIYVLTTFISQPYFSDLVWLNVSKLAATGLVMFFNYFGYKNFVFKDRGREG